MEEYGRARQATDGNIMANSEVIYAKAPQCYICTYFECLIEVRGFKFLDIY